MRKNSYPDAERIEDGLALYKKGVNYFEMDNIDLAILYLKASSIIDHNYKPYRILSKCYLKKLEHEKAFLYLKKAYETSSIQDVVAKDYALMLLERGDTEEAKRILNEILIRNPTYKPGRVLLDNINK